MPSNLPREVFPPSDVVKPHLQDLRRRLYVKAKVEPSWRDRLGLASMQCQNLASTRTTCLIATMKVTLLMIPNFMALQNTKLHVAGLIVVAEILYWFSPAPNVYLH